jgi:hypothetical protein
MSTDASAVQDASRGASLLVPTQTSPFATTGLPKLQDPSRALHAMFRSLPGSVDQSVGGFLPELIAFREASRPNIGQSPGSAQEARAKTARTASPRLIGTVTLCSS